MKQKYDRIQALCQQSRVLFHCTYGFYPPPFKLDFYTSKAITYVKWAEIRERKTFGIRLCPLLRVNVVLEDRFIPDSAVLSTFIEEYIHMVKGLENNNPHGHRFWDMALRCQTFLEGFEWKSIHAAEVISMLYSGSTGEPARELL